MKLKFVIGCLLSSLSLAVSAGLLSEKPVTWTPIIGHKHPTTKSFFDRNSLVISTATTGKISTGNVLMSLDRPETGTINGKVVQIQSMVRMLMMNCDTGLSTPIADIYYNTKLPTNESEPVKIFMYDGVLGALTTDKKSILFGLFCPEYI